MTKRKPGARMGRPPIGANAQALTRVSEEMSRQVDALAEAEEVSRSEMLRRLIAAGIEARNASPV